MDVNSDSANTTVAFGLEAAHSPVRSRTSLERGSRAVVRARAATKIPRREKATAPASQNRRCETLKDKASLCNM